MRKAPTKFIPPADDYMLLVFRCPLRRIRTKAEYDVAVAIIQELMIRADVDLTPGERDYLDAVSRFVEEYDRGHYALEHTLKTPLARLKYLMKENRMSSSDLGRLVAGRAQASLILNGKRELSKANIRALAERFAVSPAFFI